jgi:amidophosphoribosyltransferase
VQAIRDFGVKLKLNPVRGLLEGKRVVLVDDSIVRGTTSRKIVRLVREAGAKEVHVRISSPPTISPCYYGIDTPTHEELIASADSKFRPRLSEADAISLPSSSSNTSEADPSPQTVEEIRRFLEADSLGYLSIENLRNAVSDTEHRFCTSCFTGVYPTPPVQLEVQHNAQHNSQHNAQSSSENAQEPQPTVTRES